MIHKNSLSTLIKIYYNILLSQKMNFEKYVTVDFLLFIFLVTIV